MNEIAIVYISTHHGNTKKLIESLDIDKIDIYDLQLLHEIDLSQYKLVGFASGIYIGGFHNSLKEFINTHLLELDKVFLIYTSGSNIKKYGNDFKKELTSKGLNVIETYSCKGYTDNGIFKKIGGLAKNHPNHKDILKFNHFISNLIK